jgi:hypothetical protein
MLYPPAEAQKEHTRRRAGAAVPFVVRSYALLLMSLPIIEHPLRQDSRVRGGCSKRWNEIRHRLSWRPAQSARLEVAVGQRKSEN